MEPMHRFFSALFFTGLVVFAGCASSSSGTSTNGGIVGSNGVNDVNKACVIRTGWTQSNSSACARCTGLSTSGRCPCASADYEGACAPQETAIANEPGCVDAHSCETNCKQGDCACADACYAGKDACRAKAAALDGCLAEVCDSYCK